MMHGKKSETKFTIQFSRTDPSHLQVVGILNRQQRYGKAQYIVDAVKHYIKSGLADPAQRPVRLDEKHIEAVVSRILQDRKENGAAVPTAPSPSFSPAGQVNDAQLQHVRHEDDVGYGESMHALGEDGFDAVVDVLDMFRKK